MKRRKDADPESLAGPLSYDTGRIRRSLRPLPMQIETDHECRPHRSFIYSRRQIDFGFGFSLAFSMLAASPARLRRFVHRVLPILLHRILHSGCRHLVVNKRTKMTAREVCCVVANVKDLEKSLKSLGDCNFRKGKYLRRASNSQCGGEKRLPRYVHCCWRKRARSAKCQHLRRLQLKGDGPISV